MISETKTIVSICCVTYNHEKYLAQCLEGFVIQKTNFKFEILVHEDASTDKTASILKEYELKYPNLFRCVYQTENQFLIQNTLTNILFPMAKGKYIALCEGDDHWTDPLKLQKQVDFLEENPSLVGCFHNSICVDENSTIIEQQYFKKTDKKQYSQEDCLKVLHSSYSTAALIFKANAIQGQLELFSKIGSDFILDIFITNYGDLYYLDENMSAYRIHSGGIWQGSSDVYNLKVILERFLFLYNEKLYKQKYNDYLWTSILKYYDRIIKLTKNNKERNKAILRKYYFLNYFETRTYLYLVKKNKLPFYYRFKKLTSKT